jgi:imidazolonepropionase-like amidohydrolase
MRKYVAEIFPMVDSVPPDADVVGMQLFAKRVATAGMLHQAGVTVLVGTDAPLRNSPPGFGLHEEMLLLVRSGMTPFEVIRAATLESARFLGLADSLGTIEVGKVAELVLLTANPLTDIRNSSRSEIVIANGRVYRVRRDTAGRLIDVVRDRM